MKPLTAVPTNTRWSYHADFASPSWLERQSLRHPDELTPWIIAVLWSFGLFMFGMSVVGLVVSVQWLWTHWLH